MWDDELGKWWSTIYNNIREQEIKLHLHFMQDWRNNINIKYIKEGMYRYIRYVHRSPEEIRGLVVLLITKYQSV